MSRRCCAAHETKSRPLDSVVQIKMCKKEMLVHIAAHQPLLERVSVQEALPCGDFGLLPRGKLRGPVVQRALLDPTDDLLLIRWIDARQAERHPSEWMGFFIKIENLDLWASATAWRCRRPGMLTLRGNGGFKRSERRVCAPSPLPMAAPGSI